METTIVNHFLLEIADIKVPRDKEGKVKLQDYHGVRLAEDRYGREESNDKVECHIPSMSIADLQKFLVMMGKSVDDYKTDDQLEISAEHLLKEFVPAFKTYFAKQQIEHPEVIAEYRVKSKAILESSAISTLKKYTDKAVEIVLNDKTKGSVDIQATIDAMLLINKKVDELNRRPIFYKDILSGADKIRNLMATKDVSNNKELVAQLK